MPNLIKTYQHIYAWGKVMGSMPYYSELQAEKAAADGAPADVTFYYSAADLAQYGVNAPYDPDRYFQAGERVWSRWRPSEKKPAGTVEQMERALREVQISLGK